MHGRVLAGFAALALVFMSCASEGDVAAATSTLATVEAESSGGDTPGVAIEDALTMAAPAVEAGGFDIETGLIQVIAIGLNDDGVVTASELEDLPLWGFIVTQPDNSRQLLTTVSFDPATSTFKSTPEIGGPYSGHPENLLTPLDRVPTTSEIAGWLSGAGLAEDGKDLVLNVVSLDGTQQAALYAHEETNLGLGRDYFADWVSPITADGTGEEFVVG